MESYCIHQGKGRLRAGRYCKSQSLTETLVTSFGAKDGGGRKGIFFLFLLLFFYFRERKREKETLIGCLPYASWPGIEPTTWVCTLTGNQTRNLVVYGMMLQPTEPHQPGQKFFTTLWFLMRSVQPDTEQRIFASPQASCWYPSLYIFFKCRSPKGYGG